MILQYNISVLGKVQGVWFRKYTQQKAKDLKLLGIVKNQLDSSVYIEAVGDEKTLNSFINWLKTEGSPLSQVSEVTYNTTKQIKNYINFDIIK
ncbi:MAG: acylphosphatase [Flavobacteriaceae bacterium]|mgnify:CR=1 FL=1